MGFLYDDKTVVAIKMEAVNGTWLAPDATSSDECLQVLRGLTIDGLPSESVEIDAYAGSVVDKNAVYNGKKMPKISFSTYLKLKDDVIVESTSDWNAIFTLFQIWAQDDMVYDAGNNKLTWTFGDKINEKTASLAVYQDGHVWQFKGCKAEVTIKAIPGQNVVCDWVLTGLYHGGTTAALPTPSIWGDHYVVGKDHTAAGVTSETIEGWELSSGGTIDYVETASSSYGVEENYRDKYRFTIKFTSVVNAATRVSSEEVGDTMGITLETDSSTLPQLIFELTSGTEIDGYVNVRKQKADKGLVKFDNELIGYNIDGVSLVFTSVTA